jgi:hypothetical protein
MSRGVSSVTFVACLAAVALSGCKKESAPVAATTPAAAPAEKAAAAASGEITFSRQPPAVGAKFANTNSMKMEFEITGKAEGQEINSKSTSTESSKYTVEYLATDGEAVTRGKLTYTEKKTTDVEDGEVKETVKPVANKSYLVEQKGDDVEIKPATGKGELAEDEESAVSEDTEFLGTDPVREAIPTRAIKIGETVPELKAAIEGIVSQSAGKGGDKSSLSNVSVTLKEDRGDVGVFALTMTMSSTDEGMKTVVELKGALEVRKSDSAMMVLRLEGPLSLKKVDASAGTLSGKGSMSIVLAQKAL